MDEQANVQNPAPTNPPSGNQTQIASAIILAGVIIAGAIFLRGGSAPKDLSTLSPKFNQCLDSGKYRDAITDSKNKGSEAGVSGTPKGFMVSGGTVLGTIDGAEDTNVIKGRIDAILAGGGTPKTTKLEPVSDTDFILGDPNAKVTIILYEDFQCPFCGRFFADTESTIRNTYVKDGTVRLVYRDFPFLGSESFKAAEAARCAAEQGKFWEYHDYLYSHQMGENQGAFADTKLKTFAGTLKLK
jgi:protein-disulfide isomerase